MYWIDLVQGKNECRAPVYMITELRDPQNFAKLLSSYTTGGFSRRARLHEVIVSWLVSGHV
jgi:hypothetical protein